jgi:predicted PurR-regulated permease PerM
MDNQNSTLIDSAIKITIIALLALWCFKIAAPFINLIIWAGIIAIGLYPVQLWIENRTKLSSGRTSLLLTLVVLAVLLVPTFLLSGALLENAQNLTSQLSGNAVAIPPPVDGVEKIPLIGEPLAAFWQHAHEDPQAALGPLTPQVKFLAGKILKITTGLGLGILGFIFSIIIAGLFMASATGAKSVVVAILTRLAGSKRGLELTNLSISTVKSVVTGILGIAVMQAILSGLGFIVMDIPVAGLLALICLILAIVQIDILLVLIPISIYTFYVSETWVAIIFLIWNLVVGLSNNVLKPILLAKGVDVPMPIIFIGAIGGMMLSGIIGLFVGAVVMVLGYTLFSDWLKQPVSSEES